MLMTAAGTPLASASTAHSLELPLQTDRMLMNVQYCLVLYFQII